MSSVRKDLSGRTSDSLLRSAPRARADVSQLTTEEVIHALFPQRVIESARRAAEADAAYGPRSVASAFDIEDRCRMFLEQLRWPEGVRCPRCDASKGISRIESRGQFECSACGYQFSVRVGTIFHASHLPLWKWFLAVYLIGGSQDGISANQLARMLDISYKTAWYLTHRVRAAMRDDAAPPPQGVSEAVRARMGHKGKHLSALQDEKAFHAKNRGNRYVFRDLVSRLIGVESMPYTQLIASA
jgi:transposase-like protein